VTPTTIVECRRLTKVFKDFWFRPRVTAVEDLSLTIEAGETVGLVGPNGSGKSTTIKLLLGLLFPTRGEVRVFGEPTSAVQLKHRIGYLPEESLPYRFLNAEETLDFYARLFGFPRAERRRRIRDLIEAVGLEGARRRPVGEYSKGMQRRLGLAQALINDPDLLILDEPTAGMDPVATGQVQALLLELSLRGKTIILCTHLLGEVEHVCSRLVMLYGGKQLCDGSVDALLEDRKYQSLQVDLLDDATLEKVRALLAQEGKNIVGVETPRRRLEEIFLERVKSAEGGGMATSGATSGSLIPAFLAGEGAGQTVEVRPTDGSSSSSRAAASPGGEED
jgi:ABC-2 type transport system ATP-binding protein